jgi:uncharacterized protein (TIGR02145 family)
LPTNEEWNTLISATGEIGTAGNRLKDGVAWNDNSTDDFAFSALPGGFYNAVGKAFTDLGNKGFWWTAMPSGSTNAYIRFMQYNYSDVSWSATQYSQQDGFSVRCLKN